MMATVPHVTSDSGLRKFQADGFLLDRVNLYLLSQGVGSRRHRFQILNPHYREKREIYEGGNITHKQETCAGVGRKI